MKAFLRGIFITLCAAGILFSGGAVMAQDIYGFKAKLIDGKEVSLSDYRGKAVLIVNTASKCGFTPQYASLEKLYERYKDRGFIILAFPSNNLWARNRDPMKRSGNFVSFASMSHSRFLRRSMSKGTRSTRSMRT